MASTLATVGFAVKDDAALATMLDQLVPDESGGSGRGGTTFRWYEDPSGAVLTVVRSGGQVVDLVPSYAGPRGVRLSGGRPHGGYVAFDVVDDGGRVANQLLVDLRQARLMPPSGLDAPAPASLCALGVSVRVGVEEGPTTLRSTGLFDAAPDADPTPQARLSGEVVDATTVTNLVTRQEFHAVTVEIPGGHLVLCLAADEHPVAPAVGATVAGTVWLAADVPALTDAARPPRRGWFRRR